MSVIQSHPPIFALFMALMVMALVVPNEALETEEDGAEFKMLYTTATQLKYYSKGKEGVTHRNISGDFDGGPTGVTFDARNDIAYWLDDKFFAIYGKSLNGNDERKTILDKGMTMPYGVAFDWIAGNIYFVDYSSKYISVCNNVSANCSKIIQRQHLESSPYEITLDPNSGIMFWTEVFIDGTSWAVYRSGMDSVGQYVILTRHQSSMRGITLDVDLGRLFWSDNTHNTLESCKIDGTDQKILVSRPRAKYFAPYFVATDGDRMYWSSSDGPVSYKIQSAEKEKGTDIKVFATGNEKIIYITMVSEKKQPILRTNPCRDAGCSHLCTLSAYYTCSCISAYGVIEDNPTCHVIPPARNETVPEVPEENVPNKSSTVSKPAVKKNAKIGFGVILKSHHVAFAIIMYTILIMVILALVAWIIYLFKRRNNSRVVLSEILMEEMKHAAM